MRYICDLTQIWSEITMAVPLLFVTKFTCTNLELAVNRRQDFAAPLEKAFLLQSNNANEKKKITFPMLKGSWMVGFDWMHALEQRMWRCTHHIKPYRWCFFSISFTFLLTNQLFFLLFLLWTLIYQCLYINVCINRNRKKPSGKSQNMREV